MAINIATKAILKILSFGGIDVEVSRQLADLKRLDPMKIFYKKMDLQVYNGDYEVPIRVFFPDERLVMQFQAVVVKVSEHRNGVKRFLRREQRGRREKGGGQQFFYHDSTLSVPGSRTASDYLQ